MQDSYYKSIIENSDDAIVSKSTEGIIISWNQGAEKIFGYKSDEVIGKPMTIIFPKEKLDEEEYFLETILSGKTIKNYETIRVHKSGKLINVSVTISPIIDDDGKIIGISKIARDITYRVSLEKALRLQANFDELTQLPNRYMLKDRLNQAVLRSVRTGLPFALIFIDLDLFKNVNDQWGHEKGDHVLKTISTRIRNSVRGPDTVARLGGDEFCVVFENLNDYAQSKDITSKIIENIEKPIQVNGISINISASIGIAIYPENSRDLEVLMDQADKAMYESKRKGTGQITFYTKIRVTEET